MSAWTGIPRWSGWWLRLGRWWYHPLRPWHPVPVIAGGTVMVQNLVQTHWRFYADDAAPGSATPLAAEDTAPTGLVQNDVVRLRLQCKNNGDANANGVVIRLEYREAGGTFAPVPTSGGADWELALSDHFADLDTVSSAALTVDGDATTFRTGVAQESSNPGASANLLIANTTEYEWNLRFVGNATKTWEFRYTNNGTLYEDYTHAPATVQTDVVAGDTALEGALSGAAAVTGALTTQIAMTASVAASAVVAASLTTAIALGAAPAASASVSADLTAGAAEMLSKVGSLNISTAAAGNTVAVSDVGFTPKVVLFWWSGRTDATDAAGNATHDFGAGFAHSASAFRCVAGSSLHNASQPGAVKGHRADACIARLVPDTTTWDGFADLQSLDAGGFTLEILDAFSVDLRVHYLALGGDQITGVASGLIGALTSTGLQQTTGLSFQPDCLWLLGTNISSSPPAALGDQGLTIGMATGPSAQFVAGFAANDPASPASSVTKSYSRADECLVQFSGTLGAVDGRAAFTQFLSTGFELDWLAAASGPYRILYLALQTGGHATVGSLQTQTDTSTEVGTGSLGYQPTAALFLSHAKAASSAGTLSDGAQLSIGAATEASARRAHAARDAHNVQPTVVTTAVEHDAVYARLDGTGVVGLLDVVAFGSDAITLVMDDADPDQALVGFLAFGQTVAADTALEGSLSGTGSVSGSLTTGIPLAAAASASASVSADLTTAIPLAGALSASGQTTAALTTQIPLAAAVAASGDVAGALTTQIALAADVTATGSVVGALASDASLSAAVSATGTVAGDLTTQIPLAAAVSAAGSASGALTTAIPLAASLQAEGTVTGALTTALPLAGALSGTGTVAGDLSTAIALQAALQAAATASATFAGDTALQAALSGQATVQGALTTALPLQGSLSATGATTADLSTQIALAGSLTATGDTTGDLSTQIPLAGALSAAASVSAQLASGDTALAADLSAAASVQGELTTQVALQAALAAQAAAAGELTTGLPLAGALSATASVTADLTVPPAVVVTPPPAHVIAVPADPAAVVPAGPVAVVVAGDPSVITVAPNGAEVQG